MISALTPFCEYPMKQRVLDMGSITFYQMNTVYSHFIKWDMPSPHLKSLTISDHEGVHFHGGNFHPVYMAYRKEGHEILWQQNRIGIAREGCLIVLELS